MILSFAGISRHYAHNVLIFDAVLLGDAVVAEDDIAIRPHFDDPVKHIFIRRAVIEYDIACFEPFLTLFPKVGRLLGNREGIPALLKKRHHADADVGIGQNLVFL